MLIVFRVSKPPNALSRSSSSTGETPCLFGHDYFLLLAKQILKCQGLRLGITGS